MPISTNLTLRENIAQALTWKQGDDNWKVLIANDQALQNEKQNTSPKLSAIAGSVWAANQLMYTTGAGDLAMAAFPEDSRIFLEASSATLKREALALGNVNNTSDIDKPISTDTQQALNNKVDKEQGKGLSTNDYTTEEKNKVAGMATNTDQLQEGATNLYFTAARVRQTLLTGLAAGTNAVIVAADTVLGALAKLQAQLSSFQVQLQALGTASTRNAVGDGDVYARGGVVGTVSQVAGVPTGAIIERGSNANGLYTKYADGTMECRITFSPTDIAANNRLLSAWTYPATFTLPPIITASPSLNFSDVADPCTVVVDHGTALTASGTRICRFNLHTVTRSIGFTAIARGYWY